MGENWKWVGNKLKIMKHLYVIILIFAINNNGFSQKKIYFEFENFSENKIDSFTIWSQIGEQKVSRLYKIDGDSAVIDLPIAENNISFIVNFYRKGIKYHYLELISTTINRNLRDTTVMIPAYKFGFGDTAFWDAKYYYCDKVCNGKVTDYFKNGKKRLSGKFKNGLPRRKLYYYDKKGELIKTEKYYKDGQLKKTIIHK